MSFSTYTSTLGQSEFDVNKFNANFNLEIEKVKKQNNLIDIDKLSKLNQEAPQKTLLQYTVSDILIGIKNSWFYLIDDIFRRNFSSSIIFKDYRLYFIGMTFLIFGIILYLYNVLS